MDEQIEQRLSALLLQLKEGDSSPLAEIDALIGKRLRAFANVYYAQKADVDDAVQSFLCKLYYASKKFRESKRPFAWMIKVFKNMILNELKNVARERDYVSSAQTKTALKDSVTDQNYIENYLYMKEVLSKLSVYEQELLKYTIILELSLSETAKILHKPKSTVEYHVQKLKEKLQSLAK